MKIAIVDDLPEDRERLCRDISKWFLIHEIPLNLSPRLFENGEALLLGMREMTYDLIFLDIYMTGINGMETAKQIRKLDRDCRIIFITQTPDFAVESYEVDSSYYLLKPYSYEKLNLAMSRCCASLFRPDQSITIQGKSGEEQLCLHDIAYTEYANRHVVVHKKDGSTQFLSMKQGELAELLLIYPWFCDCTKGILVNLELVEQLQKDRFLLKNGQYLPISRLKYQNVREQFLNYSYARVRREAYD